MTNHEVSYITKREKTVTEFTEKSLSFIAYPNEHIERKTVETYWGYTEKRTDLEQYIKELAEVYNTEYKKNGGTPYIYGYFSVKVRTYFYEGDEQKTLSLQKERDNILYVFDTINSVFDSYNFFPLKCLEKFLAFKKKSLDDIHQNADNLANLRTAIKEYPEQLCLLFDKNRGLAYQYFTSIKTVSKLAQ